MAQAVADYSRLQQLYRKHPTDETAVPSLNFTAMDSIMRGVVENFQSEGKVIARIFPPEQGVLLVWGAKMLEQLVSACDNGR